MNSQSESYAAAGVDITAGYRVQRIDVIVYHMIEAR